ncbi:adhesion G protein-coupled receptor L4 [Cynoglossus semilaevis]|uniref:Adhesion G protein-coupled receptor L4 n=1 Tax=Cynoglossus semilaevis TaxID=244447 RepID=A0A3P8VGP2_CYNSE|nr:adhesion G protein-coupled receptor L4 [Cynoglossus semilaevis]
MRASTTTPEQNPNERSFQFEFKEVKKKQKPFHCECEVTEGTRTLVFESGLKAKTGRAGFKGNRKPDARKRSTSAASPLQSVLKVKSRHSSSMESLFRSPMKLVLLTAWLSSLMDPCSLSDICNSCHTNAACKSLNGSNACLCKHGYTGDGMTFCNDDDECQNVTNICGDRGTCTNTVGSYQCNCVSGYRSTGNTTFLPNDGTECQDVDECLSGPVCGPDARCHNTNGSFYCSCQRDFVPSVGTKHFHPETGVRCKEHPQKFCHDNMSCIKETVNKTLESMRNLTEPESLLKEIAKQTSGELTSVAVIAYVEALSRSTSALAAGEKKNNVKPAAVNSTLSELVNAVNNLVERDELLAWSRIEEEQRDRSITKLLHTVEESALTLAQQCSSPVELQIRASEMELKVFTFDARHNKANLFATMGADHINLTSKLSPEEERTGSVSVVFVHYHSLSDILKPSSDPAVADYSWYGGTGEITVNSRVIAAAVKPADVYQLDHVTFTLRHKEPTDTKADVTKCAFWEYEADGLKGRWATHGCRTVHVNSNTTTCSCSHLTHFAVLMSSGRANLEAHRTILTRITQLGMIISLICLSMCIFTFWFFSEIQSTRTTIHKNLCCSLFMAEFIFLVGINMITHKVFCSVIAGLLHYFFLAAFAWMCIEGIHLYLIVVGVIYNKGFLHRNFYVFGYGSPAVVVAISATLGSKYYGTDRVCWLSTENHFIWSFIGPACLIILVNLLAFVVIMYKVYRHTAVKKPEISHYENIRSCARGAMALLFVLGATWTFGVLHILNETTLTAYLFTITNAFQGMFIFIFLCVLSRKIQDEYYRLFKNVPCCFECLR